MRAAIYARRSTEQMKSVEEKSVTRQVENARAFAQARGWTVDDAYIFVDDGISGAEFEKRPGLQALLATLPRPPFARLIVSEQKSIGRESSETQYVIKRLAEADVEIFEYVGGTSLTPKNWLDKAMSAIRSAADEAHREDTRIRVHEAHTGKHAKGYCVGGRVFGYRNEDVFNGVDLHGRPLRSHVVRRVNLEESATVVRIFELYASGLGLKAIAKRLNADGVPAPKPFIRKDPTKPQPEQRWAPATIRAILGRELYRGVYVWNKSRKRTETWGKSRQRPRPESDWKRTPVPEMQIIPDDLWTQVRARRAETERGAVRFSSGRLSGRPPAHGEHNLLAGLATCALCGGGLVVETSRAKSGRNAAYVCHRRRANGTCTNTLRLPVELVNEAVLFAVEEHALTPENVEAVIRMFESGDVPDRAGALDREEIDVVKRIGRVTRALEMADGDSPSLVAKLKELESRRSGIVRERAALQPIPRLPLEVLDERLSEFRRLLRKSTTTARAVLNRVVPGRILFTPSGDGYTFAAPTRLDRLFVGVAVPRPSWMPEGTTGAEGITIEDTFERDYARLLERAYSVVAKGRLGLASPPGFEPGFQP